MKVYYSVQQVVTDIVIFLLPVPAVGVQVHVEVKILNDDFKADKQVMFVVTIT